MTWNDFDEFFARSLRETIRNNLTFEQEDRLALRARNGDDKALEELEARYFPLLCSIVSDVERNHPCGEILIPAQNDEFTDQIVLTPWDVHPNIQSPQDAVRILLAEFRVLVTKRWDPRRGNFRGYIKRFGKRTLHHAILRELGRDHSRFYYDSKKHRLFVCYKIHQVDIEDDNLDYADAKVGVEAVKAPYHTHKQTDRAELLRALAQWANRHSIDERLPLSSTERTILSGTIEGIADTILAASLKMTKRKLCDTRRAAIRKVVDVVRSTGGLDRTATGRGHYARGKGKHLTSGDDETGETSWRELFGIRSAPWWTVQGRAERGKQ